MQRKFFSVLKRLNHFAKQMDLKIWAFTLPALFALGAAFFEGASFGLMVPLINGIIQRNFSSITDNQFFVFIFSRFSSITNNPNLSIFISLVGLIFISALIKNLLQYGSTRSINHQVRKFANALRKALFDTYLSLGKPFFDKNDSGYLNNVLMDFTNSISYQIINLNQMLISFFMIIIYLVLMLKISYEITLLTIAIFPAMYFSSNWLTEKIKRTSNEYAQKRSALSKKTQNILSCIPLVYFYSQEEAEKKKFAKISDETQTLESSMDNKYSLIPSLQEIVSLLFLLILISVMALMLKNFQHKAIGSFLVFFLILRRATISFTTLNAIKAQIATISGHLNSVLAILDQKGKAFITGGSKKFDGLKENIEFCQLNFAYQKENPILQNINFVIEKGKRTAIVGPTGSGKTTLINLLLRFYDTPQGSLKIDGTDIREFTLKSLRSRMALVSQDIWLLNDTIEANITYGLTDISDEQIIETSKKARIYDFIVQLPNQFETIVGDRGVTLSGGEKQRLSIARAILKNAEILILDEATSALDSTTENLIQEALRELTKDKTCIVIAHRLSTIKNSDKIVIIENGEVIEQGTFVQLLKLNGFFS
ncbi:MAG: hypothetical protein A3G33_02030 [Omnitrophica bacterium RIFCSPLOWO2_12_FULL_44_17]|uniref:ABC transporter ATP-binding protein n=1 Tax=Candidatus Danuiimicrobium aquiferis TaxID=1801832 RepID=A0A1G1KTE2_9BACT|nr:MAG: hypothetical protein A3B72_04140 [Omnitrophica bacterium RIFCSPHIGHO2_02_FULL_45_28]OGW88634.1 MAG: hypothetical protein A3E74_03325 [Omnitrophica bacterium RIFCSPHIGHO2_12_FULL_44_12]OGW96115.1 MAG: hypothetical protein A3G33_02030 [Omnitrophica bacterium RIFCSPLOWO2_12_FULL_44_17]